MTVSTTDDRKQYAGSGSTGPFSITFPIQSSGDLKVTRTVTSTGVDTELTLNAGTDGFTVDTDLTEITLTEALGSGTETLTIERDIDITQTVDYTANSAFPAEVNEAALDKLTMIAQQLDDALDRAAKFKSTLSDSLVASINEAPLDTATLVWDGTSGNIINGPLTTDISDAATNATAAAASAVAAASSASDASDSADAAAASAASVGFTLATNNTFTGDNIFQGDVDVTDILAETSAGGSLKASGGAACISWGDGGSANTTLGGNMSGASAYKLVNMIDPTSAQDGATKAYVDAATPSSATTSAEGIVELSTDAELRTGTDTGRAVTPSNIKNALGFSNYFESSEISITNAGTGAVTHSLGGVPVMVQAIFVCKTAEAQFSIGDEIHAGTLWNIDKTTTRGVQVWGNSTQVEYQFGASTNVLNIFDTSGNEADLTNGNWRLVIRAWR